MKNDTVITLAILALGVLVFGVAKKKASAEPAETKKNEEVPVDVVETKKVSANASVTQPKYAMPTFEKEWVVLQNNVKTGLVTTSPFN